MWNKYNTGGSVPQMMDTNIPKSADGSIPRYDADGSGPIYGDVASGNAQTSPNLGVDTVSAMLRPGEFVLRPESVQALGGVEKVNELNALGGPNNPQKYAQQNRASSFASSPLSGRMPLTEITKRDRHGASVTMKFDTKAQGGSYQDADGLWGILSELQQEATKNQTANKPYRDGGSVPPIQNGIPHFFGGGWLSSLFSQDEDRQAELAAVAERQKIQDEQNALVPKINTDQIPFGDEAVLQTSSNAQDQKQEDYVQQFTGEFDAANNPIYDNVLKDFAQSTENMKGAEATLPKGRDQLEAEWAAGTPGAEEQLSFLNQMENKLPAGGVNAVPPGYGADIPNPSYPAGSKTRDELEADAAAGTPGAEEALAELVESERFRNKKVGFAEAAEARDVTGDTGKDPFDQPLNFKSSVLNKPNTDVLDNDENRKPLDLKAGAKTKQDERADLQLIRLAEKERTTADTVKNLSEQSGLDTVTDEQKAAASDYWTKFNEPTNKSNPEGSGGSGVGGEGKKVLATTGNSQEDSWFKKEFTGAFAGLFGPGALGAAITRGLVLYAGARLTGMSGQQALAYAAKDALEEGTRQNTARSEAIAAAKESKVSREKWARNNMAKFTAESLRKYVSTGQYEDLIAEEAPSTFDGFGDELWIGGIGSVSPEIGDGGKGQYVNYPGVGYVSVQKLQDLGVKVQPMRDEFRSEYVVENLSNYAEEVRKAEGLDIEGSGFYVTSVADGVNDVVQTAAVNYPNLNPQKVMKNARAAIEDAIKYKKKYPDAGVVGGEVFMEARMVTTEFPQIAVAVSGSDPAVVTDIDQIIKTDAVNYAKAENISYEQAKAGLWNDAQASWNALSQNKSFKKTYKKIGDEQKVTPFVAYTNLLFKDDEVANAAYDKWELNNKKKKKKK